MPKIHQLASKNQMSLSLLPINDYSDNEIFVTKDGYCIVIDELQQILSTSAQFLNPYTCVKFAQSDIEALMKKPEIINKILELQERQNACKETISQQTINALIALAEDLLNKSEIMSDGGDVPVAQGGYEKFTIYYQSLSGNEQSALNDFWMAPYGDTHLYLMFMVHGMKAMQFKTWHETISHSCVHSAAGSLVKMIFQLNADSQFNSPSMLATTFIEKIRNSSNSKKHNEYVIKFYDSSDNLNNTGFLSCLSCLFSRSKSLPKAEKQTKLLEPLDGYRF